MKLFSGHLPKFAGVEILKPYKAVCSGSGKRVESGTLLKLGVKVKHINYAGSRKPQSEMSPL